MKIYAETASKGITIKGGKEVVQLTLTWYQQLAKDCSQFISEAKEQIVFKHWQMGKRILEDELKFEKPEYGNHTIANLAEALSISDQTIYNQLKFVRKYSEFPNAFGNLSWRHIIGLLGEWMLARYGVP